MEGRSELALLAYAKLQLSFAAAAAAFTAAAAREGEKEEIGNGGRGATSSVTLASRICTHVQKSNRCKDHVKLGAK